MTPEERIARYISAYEAANGSLPYTVQYEKGWYRLRRNGFDKAAYRAKQLDALTNNLEWRASDDGQQFFRKKAR